MLIPAKLKSPDHYRRQIEKYDRKLQRAISPTQRNYAYRMKRAAEEGLKKSMGGAVEPEVADGAVDLGPHEYAVDAQ